MGSACSKTASDKTASFRPRKRPTLPLHRPAPNLLRSSLPDSQFVSAQVCKTANLSWSHRGPATALRSVSSSLQSAASGEPVAGRRRTHQPECIIYSQCGRADHSRRCNKHSGLLQYTHRTLVGHAQYTKCDSYIQQSNNRQIKSQLRITRSTTTTFVALEFSVPSKNRCGLWPRKYRAGRKSPSHQLTPGPVLY